MKKKVMSRREDKPWFQMVASGTEKLEMLLCVVTVCQLTLLKRL